MAEVDFDQFESGYGGGHGRRSSMSAASVIGAVASLAMVIGLGVWGYKIAMRDVMGIPVVRAMEGPMRIAPEVPGGTVAEHQGLSVNDVAASGVATPVPDSLTLAPRPQDLSSSDAAGLADPMLVPEAAVPQGFDPLTGFAPPPDEGGVRAGAGPQTGVTTSPRPRPRPAGLAQAAAQARPSPAGSDDPVMAALLEAVTQEIDPKDISAGAWLVQLGAYDGTDQARTEWDKLAGAFAEFMAGKDRVIQSATSGGRTFYRLRAHGFTDREDAQRFCSALVAEGAPCIPVAQR